MCIKQSKFTLELNCLVNHEYDMFTIDLQCTMIKLAKLLKSLSMYNPQKGASRNTNKYHTLALICCSKDST